MTQTLELRLPDDWHVHLRDGGLLRAVLPDTARHFGRAIVMPNLQPPITRAAQAQAYAARVAEALPEALPGARFQPLMTAYLTDEVDPEELARGHEAGAWVAAKLYPANATTNSAHGVTDLANIQGALEVMAQLGMPLLVHGEVTRREVDIFDREATFIAELLTPLRAAHPALPIVLEHATTAEAVAFVRAHENTAATITPHHLLINRNALFDGGLRPHAYCLPVAKRERHRLALREAATSGDARFFLGTDSAPHLRERKEMDCGCAGIYCASVALPCYAEVFEDEGALDKLEAFCSLNGPAFYGLPPNDARLTLRREPWTAPETLPVGDSHVRVFRGGETLRWRVDD